MNKKITFLIFSIAIISAVFVNSATPVFAGHNNVYGWAWAGTDEDIDGIAEAGI